MAVLVSNPGEQRARIFCGLAIRMQTVGRQPVEIGLGYRSDLHRYGLELDDRFSMPGDEYALSVEGSINQLRQVVLGFGNAVGRHAQNMAIQRL